MVSTLWEHPETPETRGWFMLVPLCSSVCFGSPAGPKSQTAVDINKGYAWARKERAGKDLADWGGEEVTCRPSWL